MRWSSSTPAATPTKGNDMDSNSGLPSGDAVHRALLRTTGSDDVSAPPPPLVVVLRHPPIEVSVNMEVTADVTDPAALRHLFEIRLAQAIENRGIRR